MTSFPYPLGATKSPPDSRDYPARMRLSNAAASSSLPSSDRLARMPVVFKQLRSSCVAMSQSTVAMKNEIDEAGGSVTLNGEVWYDKLAVEQFGDQQDSGLVPRLSLDSWLNSGAPMAYGDAKHYAIDSYYRLQTFDEVRRVITERRQPVLLVSQIAISWGDTTPTGQLFPIDYYGPNNPDIWIGLHEWVVWGYDMRSTLGMLIRSSWGYEFGKNGNCYMTQEQFERSFIEAWYVESKK